MIVIGDNLIKDLKSNGVFKVECYGNITLEEYLRYHNNSKINHDIIIYCFGYHDINNDRDINDIVIDYDKLKRGEKITYMIIPPNSKFDIDDKIKEQLYIYNFILEYKSDDTIHPDKDTLANLEVSLIEISINNN